jgi:predicted RNase H-like nuclease (RuvC/YqgF family)
MSRRIEVTAFLLAALILSLGSGIAVATPSDDTEEKLLAHIQSEHNPVKKAKDEVRLVQLKLKQAFESYGQGDFERSRNLLDQYIRRMKDAWETLETSGREASRKPQGYKELDIALREARRELEDFETRISFEERAAVEEVRKETEDLSNRVFNALFPSAPARKRAGSAGLLRA